MKKLKASFVAVLVTAMLACIDFGLFLLNKQAFAYLTGALALYGLMRGCIDFYFWLRCNSPDDAYADQPQEDFDLNEIFGEESMGHDD